MLNHEQKSDAVPVQAGGAGEPIFTPAAPEMAKQQSSKAANGVRFYLRACSDDPDLRNVYDRAVPDNRNGTGHHCVHYALSPKEAHQACEQLEAGVKAGHTPGPWTAEISEFGAMIRIGETYIPAPYQPPFGRAQCRVQEADARLIAAAPDLLAACEWARTQLRCRPHLDDPDCPACSGRNPLDAAIAKAKGGAAPFSGPALDSDVYGPCAAGSEVWKARRAASKGGAA